MPEVPFETLDPPDLDALRRLAHRMVDDAFEDIAGLRERPVWQPMPNEVEVALATPVPLDGMAAEGVYERYRSLVLPYLMGNDHPRFWAWYMGNGTMMGALAAFLAAVANPNVGGANHAAPRVEAQVVRWCAEMLGMPLDSGGLLVSGASMANLVGYAVARSVHAGVDIRTHGVAALPQPLVAYGSTELHSCHQRAVELLGLGSASLRRIPVDGDYRIDLPALERAIAEDRAAGARPYLVAGSAGTINTGSVDDLEALADLCHREGLWFHVDGAIGALVTLAPALAPLVRGIERADSVALDLHKWMHVPFEAGMVLVRNEAEHRATFTLTPAYLEHTARGLAGGATWPSDYGVQLSRDFKALKVWMALQERGVAAYGRMMARNVEQATTFAARLQELPHWEVGAPVVLDIVCFRTVPPGLTAEAIDDLNRELLLRIVERGIAAPSSTWLDGRFYLRLAISNHRTHDDDLRMFLEALQMIAGDLVAAGTG
jgi:aromatic-L-amino-acid/L-tryptophan decarboxylase